MNAMRETLDHASVAADIAAATAFMQAHPAIDGAKLACVGLSFGGRFALAAGVAEESPFSLIVTVHAGGLAIDAPDSPHWRAAKLRGNLYVAAAEDDKQFPPDQRERLDAALRAADASYEIEVFAGSKHGFATPESAAHDPQQADAMWREVELRLRNVLAA